MLKNIVFCVFYCTPRFMFHCVLFGYHNFSIIKTTFDYFRNFVLKKCCGSSDLAGSGSTSENLDQEQRKNNDSTPIKIEILSILGRIRIHIKIKWIRIHIKMKWIRNDPHREKSIYRQNKRIFFMN